jgi:hypothetical protein
LRGRASQDWRRYRSDWREPKLLIIYEFDEHGRMIPGSKSTIDGTFSGPSAALSRMCESKMAFGLFCGVPVVPGSAPNIEEIVERDQARRLGQRIGAGHCGIVLADVQGAGRIVRMRAESTIRGNANICWDGMA